MILSVAAAAAQSTYPAKPIRIVVPFSAGGSTDLLARGISERLTRAWGQQVVVDNRAGADGIVATEIVAKADPDGYTLLMNAIGHAANASLYKKLPYDTLRDFAPVILVADAPMVLSVHPQLKVNTVSQLVALARAKPGQLNCATGGIGASHHLAAEVFRFAAGIQFLEVHYKGAAPAVLELISGRMDMMFAPILVSMTHVKSGRLKALGVTSPQRVVIAPDLPTIAESGVPGYEARAWYGLVAPAKLDPTIVTKLNAEIDQALRTAEFRDRLLAAGAVPMGGSSQEFGDFMRREVQKYAAVVRQAKISVD
jgi:tripartite-type tricarboxylate transporter receptor subunit TctC